MHKNHDLAKGYVVLKAHQNNGLGEHLAKIVTESGGFKPEEHNAAMGIVDSMREGVNGIKSVMVSHQLGDYKSASASLGEVDEKFRNAWLSTKNSLGDEHPWTTLLQRHHKAQMQASDGYRRLLGLDSEIDQRKQTHSEFENIMKNQNLGSQFD
jgi:hypothetical protein